MPSQIAELEASIAQLERDNFPENPSLKGLRLKVAGLYGQREKEKHNLAINELLGKSWNR